MPPSTSQRPPEVPSNLPVPISTFKPPQTPSSPLNVPQQPQRARSAGVVNGPGGFLRCISSLIQHGRASRVDAERAAGGAMACGGSEVPTWTNGTCRGAQKGSNELLESLSALQGVCERFFWHLPQSVLLDGQTSPVHLPLGGPRTGDLGPRMAAAESAGTHLVRCLEESKHTHNEEQLSDAATLRRSPQCFGNQWKPGNPGCCRAPFICHAPWHRPDICAANSCIGHIGSIGMISTM